jgi:hypothetical protein
MSSGMRSKVRQLDKNAQRPKNGKGEEEKKPRTRVAQFIPTLPALRMSLKGKPKKGGGGFISFSDVTAPDSAETSSGAVHQASSSSSSAASSSGGPLSSPLYTGSDGELAQACKRVVKKDATTKLKAMAEIAEILGSSRGGEVIGDFLPYFVYMMPRLALETTRKVREQLCVILDGVIAINKQALGPFMKLLIGPWWMLSCDPCREVALAFSAAFATAIPPKKRPSVLAFLAPSLMDYCSRNVNQKIDTLSDLTSVSKVRMEQNAHERQGRI